MRIAEIHPTQKSGEKMVIRGALLCSVLLLLWPLISAAQQDASPLDHQRWDKLLKTHVVESNNGSTTTVNYQGLLNEQADLKQYLSQLSRVSKTDFDRWSKVDQLAFLINAYNAWTVQLILTRYPDLESIKELGSLFSSPWSKSFIPLFGKKRSLDFIEHQLIRGSGRYQEPRIHFAVNCASIGCPALKAEAYLGSQLEQQLADVTEQFLRDRSRNRIQGDELQVSSIFKWYRDDFEQGWQGQKSLAEFLVAQAEALNLSKNQQRDLLSGAIDIIFLDYDWTLNDSRRSGQ